VQIITPPTDELTTFWAKLYHGQDSRIQKNIRIDIKPVLPRSELLHKFHSTYSKLRPQGWQVHYTCEAAEASYAVLRCLIFVRPNKKNIYIKIMHI